MRISRVTFHHYKAFQDFSITLSDFDVLVGPNNSGKSTVLGAFRVLSEGIRKANFRKAEFVDGPQGQRWGYRLDLTDIPVSLENVLGAALLERSNFLARDCWKRGEESVA